MIRVSNINEFVDNFNNKEQGQWIPITLNMIGYPNVPRVRINGVLIYDTRIHQIFFYISIKNKENTISPFSQEFADYCEQKHINHYMFSITVPVRATFLTKGDIQTQIKKRDIYNLVDSVSFVDNLSLNPNLE